MVSNKRRMSRGGWTLIEVIIVLAIIGLLAALVAPAVQQVRIVSKRMGCQSKLRQVGIAMHSFHEGNNGFPSTTQSWEELLPGLDQAALYDRIKSQNYDQMTKVPVYRCDMDVKNITVVGVNVSLNDGLGFRNFGYDGMEQTSPALVSLGDVTDGTSQTAHVSERLFPFGLDRMAWFTLTSHRGASEIDQFAKACRGQRLSPVYPGVTYADSSGCLLTCATNGYNAVLGPNSPSCFNGPPSDPDSTSARHQALSASSLHPNGVNVLMVDGAVRFVADGIDIKVWRAMSSRNGNDTAE